MIVDPFCYSVPDSYFDLDHLVCQPLLDYVRVAYTMPCHERCIAERVPYLAVVVVSCSCSVFHLVVDDFGLVGPGDFGESEDHLRNYCLAVAAYFASFFRGLSYPVCLEAQIWPWAHYWYCLYSCFVVVLNA